MSESSFAQSNPAYAPPVDNPVDDLATDVVVEAVAEDTQEEELIATEELTEKENDDD